MNILAAVSEILRYSVFNPSSLPHGRQHTPAIHRGHAFVVMDGLVSRQAAVPTNPGMPLWAYPDPRNYRVQAMPENKARLEEIERAFDRRLGEIDKRLSDTNSSIRATATMLGTIIGGIFGGMAIIGLVFSYNERATDAQFRTDMRTEINESLGKVDDAELEFVTVKENALLAGKDIIAIVYQLPPEPKNWKETHFLPYEKWTAKVPFAVRNLSKSASHNAFLKTYFNKPFFGLSASADERNYDFEVVSVPGDLKSLDYLPGYATVTIGCFLDSIDRPTVGRHEILFKLYYGNGKSIEAQVYAVVQDSSATQPAAPPAQLVNEPVGK